MATETTKGFLAGAAELEPQDANSNDTMSLDGGEICAVDVEIDNALSEDLNMPALLDGQSEFFLASTPVKDSSKAVTDNQGKETDKSMEVTDETGGDTLMADEEIASDQSRLSEGIVVNSDGVNRIAAFDTEFPPSDPPLDLVKTEPIDIDEDVNLDGNAVDPNLSLTQCALQLQFSENGFEAGVALVKKEKIKGKRGRPRKEAGGISKKHNKIHHRSTKKATGIPPTDLCLVCSAPCIITRNRKIPSLPFCRKCKKAYFYQLASRMKKHRTKCPSDRNCIIHYKSGSHCSICHLEKFQQILRSSKAAFRSEAAANRDDSASIRTKRNSGDPKDSSMYMNDQQLIREALKTYPLVVLNKMDMDPDEIYDTKDLPDVFVTAVNRADPEKIPEPRMFAMPDDDVVKQEVCFPPSGKESFDAENPVLDLSPKSAINDNPSPKLGAINIPVVPKQSCSNTTVSSSPVPTKRGPGRPKKTPLPSPEQGISKNTSPEILKTILSEPPSGLRRVEAGEKDIKIFVFQCGHACSSCNNSPSKKWLKQNGFPTVDPVQQKPPDVQADLSLYQKFIEFYNAAVESVPQNKVSKTRHTNNQPERGYITELPIPTPVQSIRMFRPPGSSPSSSSHPTMVMIPPTQQQLLGLASPLSGPSSLNLGVGLPSPTFQTTGPTSKLHFSPVNPVVNSPNSSQERLQRKSEKVSVKNTIRISDPVPPLAHIDAVRLALNSHLMQQNGQFNYLQGNRFMLAPQNLPVGLPLQAITPSSSVRQPRAPYLLSPSVRVSGKGSSSSSKTQPP